MRIAVEVVLVRTNAIRSYIYFCLQRMVLDAVSENVPSDMSASENSDQPAHLCSLIRIFTGRILTAITRFFFSNGQQSL